MSFWQSNTIDRLSLSLKLYFLKCVFVYKEMMDLVLPTWHF
jgi:hypothetical protein